MKTLTIISHTEHYLRSDGSLVGLNSTVTEINHLLSIFSTIIHVGMLHNTEAPPNSLPYCSDRIRFVALPALGGAQLVDKTKLCLAAPKIIRIVKQALAESTHFQFRAPTGIGVFVIPYLIWFSSKEGWFKYAGNWNQKNALVSYKFQRYLLRHQQRKVTINGFWPEQPDHCISFENPCLTEQEIESGRSTRATKQFQDTIQLCFVGRLEAAKGVDIILDTIAELEAEMYTKIEVVHLVGHGLNEANYKKAVENRNLPCLFHGLLSRSDVHNIYKQAHAIILPSVSEGFPKVIAEAMNFGCIPIVSNISSISQYISQNETGFIMESIDVNGLKKELLKLLNLSNLEYGQIISNAGADIEKFSYGHYNNRIKAEIL